MKLVPDGWRWPRLILHLFDHPSTTVSLGLWLFIVASWGCFAIRGGQRLEPEDWMICVGVSGILVGGVRFGKDMLSFFALKFGSKIPDPKEAKPDAVPVADPPK